jgi:hypothetical protein
MENSEISFTHKKQWLSSPLWFSDKRIFKPKLLCYEVPPYAVTHTVVIGADDCEVLQIGPLSVCLKTYPLVDFTLLLLQIEF